MPPSFDKPLTRKFIQQVAEQVIPEVVQSPQEQDSIMKSVSELPEITDRQMMMELNQDISKALMGGNGLKANKDDTEPKSFVFDPYSFVDTLTHKQQITGLSYTTLAEMARQCKPISAIINTRISQVASFAKIPRNKYDIGFHVERPDGKPMSDSEKKEAQKYEAFLVGCGEGDAVLKRDYFDSFIRKSVRDRLTYDQWNFERVFTYGNKLHEFLAIDAATIRIALRKYLNEKDPRKDTTDLQIVNDRGRGFARVNVPIESKAFVQVLNSQIVTEYTENEMAFLVAWPRTDVKVAGYGYSEVEMLTETITAILFASEYNRRFFSSGSSPKGVLNVKGNMSQIQLDSFKRAWMAQLSGITGAWRTPIVAAEGGLEFVNMQATNREMEFSKYNDFLIKLACAVFLIAPEEINFSSSSNANGAMPMIESKQEMRLKSSRDKGLVPLLTFIENGINREIMRFLTNKFVFRFAGMDGLDEVSKVDLDLKKLTGFMTINEVRREHELPPIEGGDVINNQAFMGVFQSEQQQIQMDKQTENQRQQQEDAQKFQMKQMKAQAKAQGAAQGGEQGGEGGGDDFEGFQDEIQKGIKSGDFTRVIKELKSKPVEINLEV